MRLGIASGGRVQLGKIKTQSDACGQESSVRGEGVCGSERRSPGAVHGGRDTSAASRDGNGGAQRWSGNGCPRNQRLRQGAQEAGNGARRARHRC